MLYPTIVIGVGDALQGAIRSVQSLLDTHAPHLTPIVRVGSITNGGILTDGYGQPVSPPIAPPSGTRMPASENAAEDPLASALAMWIESVITERHLEAVRAEGVSVGSPRGRLFVRVALVIDRSVALELCERVLSALQAAAEAVPQPLPMRLTCVALAEGSVNTECGVPLHAWLQQYRSDRLEPNLTLVLDRWRSDGSCLNMEEVYEALPFLLFLALLTTQAQEHWFFPSPTQNRQPQTVGLGITIIPITDIESALSHALLADLLTLMTTPPDPDATPNLFLEPFQLTDTFDERALWQSLFEGLPVDLSTPADQPFSVRLPQHAINSNMERLPPQEWSGHLEEYDRQLDTALTEEWIPQMRQNRTRQVTHLLERIQQVLSTAVREGKGMFALADAAIEQIRAILDNEWLSTSAETPSAAPEPDLTDVQRALEEAIQQVPTGRSIAVRSAMLMLVLVVLAPVLAWGLGALYNWSLPFVLGVGSLLLLAGGGLTWWSIGKLRRDAHQRLQEALSASIRAIAEKYERQLANEGVRLLREIRETLLNHLEREEARLTHLRRSIETDIAQARTMAHHFTPSSPALVRAVVDNWQHLEPIARDLWGNRELKPFLQSMLEQSGITTLEQLSQLSGSQTQPSVLVRCWIDPAKARLEDWSDDKPLRRFHYYLQHRFPSSVEREAWVKQRVRQNYDQATKLLWTNLGDERRVWQILPFDEDGLADLVAAHHPEQVSQSERLYVPGVMGTICFQEVLIEENHSV